ncbi:GNAT family N-acetyltransferase [Nitrosomonas sp. HPC101]|uniref:GNAT family N-acetyltransferase n=1 Tax=Nitrosomonas sp. HPC101 TaxID=1658667 RepID=UPI001372237D|nr:GNAT family N-acetyltransferase [Nitrosomonas sp. HPC101]MXS85634.1 GNAT family N-acetyltransferase [Nitrosomonas sp. HPC101]
MDQPIKKYKSSNDLPIGSQKLFDSGEKDSFDLSRDWFSLLETTVIRQTKEVCIFTLETEGVIQGIWPTILHKNGKFSPRQIDGFTCFYSSLYRPLISSSLSIEDLAGYLKKMLSDTRVDVLRFDIMDPAQSGFNLHEQAFKKIGFKTDRFFCWGNWYLPVNNRSFSDYLQGLSSRVRNTLERRKKKFLAGGRGKLEILTTHDKLPIAIDAWEKIYNASWKIPEPYPEFIPALISLCASRGWLRLGIAYYDEEPIAAQLWIVNHGRAAIYKLAYDEKFAKFSPGTILTAHLMQHAIDVDKVHEVDYLTGDDAYKKDWMSHRRERFGLVAYNPGSFWGLICMSRHLAGKIRKRVMHRSK